MFTKNTTDLSDNLWVLFMGSSNPNTEYNKMFKHYDILSQKQMHFGRSGL